MFTIKRNDFAGEAQARGMKTLAEWKIIPANDLRVLKRLEGRDEMSQMRHAMKAQEEIGQHCVVKQEKVSRIENLLSLKGG
jgi:hypothetical protein